MATHARHLGQKYMGIRPQSHSDAMFSVEYSSVHTEGDHLVPVSNFLNAQCTLLYLRHSKAPTNS
jgi:saccharopepsin